MLATVALDEKGCQEVYRDQQMTSCPVVRCINGLFRWSFLNLTSLLKKHED